MSTLGHLTQTGEKSFQGELSLLNWRGEIALRELKDAFSTNAPDMEVVTTSGVQIGTARYRQNKRDGGEYVQVTIKHPQLTMDGRPIFANLGKANDVENEDGRVFAIIAN